MAPAQSPSPEPSASESDIPVQLTEITIALEAVRSRLAVLEQALVTDATTDEISGQLPALAEEILARTEADAELLAGSPGLDTIRGAETAWGDLARRLSPWKKRLTARATELDAVALELDELAVRWANKLEQSLSQDAPPAVIENVNKVLEAIRLDRRLADERRKQVLTLLTSVIAEDETVSRAAEQMATIRAQAVGRILVQDGTPIWRAGQPLALAELERVISAQGLELRLYALRHSGSLLAHLALLAALFLCVRWAARLVESWVVAEPALGRTAQIFRVPLATATVLAVVLGQGFYLQPPRLLTALLGALALVPAMILLRRLLDRQLYPVLYALVLFGALDLTRALVSSLQELARFLFVGEMLAALAFVVWLRARLDSEASDGWVRTALTLGSQAALFVFSVALLASAMGFVSLGYLVGEGVLKSAYLAVLLYAALQIVDGLAMLALRTRPLKLLGVVQRHRSFIRRRLRLILSFLALTAWGLITLDFFNLLAGLTVIAKSLAEFQIGIGAIQLSLGDVLTFVLTVWASFLISRLLRFALEEDVYTRVHLPGGLPYALSTLLHYAILLIGFLVALASLGVDTTRFAILAGALGVGIGLGMQNVVNNFVSGLILLFERPVKLGDVVEVSDQLGTLGRIGLRSCVLRTFQGADVIIPNATMIASNVTNWTLTDAQRRIEIVVGVDYGTDPRRVCSLLTQLAGEHPDILTDPPVKVNFLGFGESSLDFRLNAWTQAFDRWVDVQSELTIRVYEVLTEAGIGIPFPQRTVHIHERSVTQTPCVVAGP